MDAEEIAQGIDALAKGTVEFMAKLNTEDHPSLAELQPMLAAYIRVHEKDAANVRALGEEIEQLRDKLEMTQAAREQAESLAEGLAHDRDGQLERLDEMRTLAAKHSESADKAWAALPVALRALEDAEPVEADGRWTDCALCGENGSVAHEPTCPLPSALAAVRAVLEGE